MKLEHLANYVIVIVTLCIKNTSTSQKRSKGQRSLFKLFDFLLWDVEKGNDIFGG